ncbi:MAG: hypothetical protein OHK0012_03600 [Synechococcales cyanobacterium]
MTDADDTLARSLFTAEGKKPTQRKRSSTAKSTGEAVSTAPVTSSDTGTSEEPSAAVETQATANAELARVQALAIAWEGKYQHVQTELDTLRPQLAQLQAKVEQQVKTIQEQQEAIAFWQQKAETKPQVLPALPKNLKSQPLPPQPKPTLSTRVDALPDFMLD